MTRKALEAFDPAKLRNGHGKIFETRNPETGYGEHHYFYRDSDGELFTMVDHRRDVCEKARKEWQKLKRTKPENRFYRLSKHIQSRCAAGFIFGIIGDQNDL